MSVFTHIERSQLEEFLGAYSVGALVGFEGVTTGVSNTNYFVDTSAGGYVLTVFEIVPHEDIPFCLEFAAHLSEHGVPSPHPVADDAGRYLGTVCGKPAALWQKIAGSSIERPQPLHCGLVGAVLARLHKAGRSFNGRRDNPCGLEWAQHSYAALRGHLNAEDERLMESELRMQAEIPLGDLPCGVIHADLFIDNVLFEGDRLGGIIDFYYACTGPLVLDLAITVNDWCHGVDGAPFEERRAALLAAYLAERPLEPLEQQWWNRISRQAALRFWISRARDVHFPRDGTMILVKDPESYKNVLLHHAGQQDAAPDFPRHRNSAS